MNKEKSKTSKKVYISVINDLVTDQRVHKVATSLLSAGHVPVLIGRKLKHSNKVNRDYKCVRFRLLFNSGPFFYIFYNIRLFFYLLLRKADIYLSNDIDTLPANYFAARFRAKKLLFDSHELFSEVPELVNRPKVKLFWQMLEDYFFPKLKNAYTVCDSIAEVYKKKYATDFFVVRNVPFQKKEKKQEIEKNEHPKIILYQGALNLGRGLKHAIQAMQWVDNSILWIIGDGDISISLKKIVEKLNLEQKVIFKGRLPFSDLQELTSQASIGISIEENLGLNYYYALPNKLFDYIHAGIPVVTSNFPEMKKIVKKYNIGSTIQTHEPKYLSDVFNSVLNNAEQLGEWRKNTEKARNELYWEKEIEPLLQLVDNL